jgi:RNA-directed DNA polymerase
MTQRTGIRRELEVPEQSVAGASLRLLDWHSINWKRVNQDARRLQRRLVEAQQRGQKRTVRALQFILRRSFSARCLAVRRVTENSGRRTPGGDGQSLDAPTKKAQAVQKLTTEDYRAQPLKRVFIPKGNEKLRPLGIPTMHDRVVQTAVKLIIEPIFEADFEDCSSGFRPGRSAHDALREIRTHLQNGFREVYDADLQSYFDTIPHEKLMKCLGTRISDGRLWKPIRQWLRAVVEEEDEQGKPRYRRSAQGTAQGGVRANLDLHCFDKLFRRHAGPAQWANARLVGDADDFGVLARYQGAELKPWVEATLEDGMELKINWEKPRVVNLNEEGARLDFLSYTFRYDDSLSEGKVTQRRHSAASTTPSRRAGNNT